MSIDFNKYGSREVKQQEFDKIRLPVRVETGKEIPMNNEFLVRVS